MATAVALASCEEGETPNITPEEPIDPNAPTTFSFRLEEETDLFSDAMSAYFEEGTGLCKLIAKHGDLVPFVDTEPVTMTAEGYHAPISLFYCNGMWLRATFTPERGKHTTFIISLAALGKNGATGEGIFENLKDEFNWPH